MPIPLRISLKIYTMRLYVHSFTFLMSPTIDTQPVGKKNKRTTMIECTESSACMYVLQFPRKLSLLGDRLRRKSCGTNLFSWHCTVPCVGLFEWMFVRRPIDKNNNNDADDGRPNKKFVHTAWLYKYVSLDTATFSFLCDKSQEMRVYLGRLGVSGIMPRYNCWRSRSNYRKYVRILLFTMLENRFQEETPVQRWY